MSCPTNQRPPGVITGIWSQQAAQAKREQMNANDMTLTVKTRMPRTSFVAYLYLATNSFIYLRILKGAPCKIGYRQKHWRCHVKPVDSWQRSNWLVCMECSLCTRCLSCKHSGRFVCLRPCYRCSCPGLRRRDIAVACLQTIDSIDLIRKCMDGQNANCLQAWKPLILVDRQEFKAVEKFYDPTSRSALQKKRYSSSSCISLALFGMRCRVGEIWPVRLNTSGTKNRKNAERCWISEVPVPCSHTQYWTSAQETMV